MVIVPGHEFKPREFIFHFEVFILSFELESK